MSDGASRVNDINGSTGDNTYSSGQTSFSHNCADIVLVYGFGHNIVGRFSLVGAFMKSSGTFASTIMIKCLVNDIIIRRNFSL